MTGTGGSATPLWYARFTVSGGSLSANPVNPATRIIETSPANLDLIASTSTLFDWGARGYVSEEDWNEDTRLDLEFWNGGLQSQNLLGIGFLGTVSTANRQRTSYDIPLDGFFNYSTSTTATAIGRYQFTAKIIKKRFFFFDDVLAIRSGSFIVGTTTAFDNLQDQVSDQLGDLLGSASSTIAVGQVCNPLSGFDVVSCMLALFVPSPAELSGFITSLRDRVLTSFPIGYVTDFVEIVTSSSTIPLIILDAEIPSVLPGGGSSITLDISHSLDYILNATSGVFITDSASSTETFYEITSFYWEIIVYIGLAFYLLRRILGSHLIPHL